jgi:hypothetical protein
MSDIDWLAVETVCTGTAIAGLTKAEMTAAIRRMNHRIRNNDDGCYADHKISLDEVARRLCTNERMVLRIRESLPAVKPTKCPVCCQQVWVAEGFVEPHPDTAHFNYDCPMSRQQMLTGLAAERPDLYRWLEVV